MLANITSVFYYCRFSRTCRQLARITLLSQLLLLLAACSGGSGSSAEPISVDISGTVRYEDKQYGRYGFTGVTGFKAVRYSIVELVDTYDEIIDSTVTDESGYYALSGTGVELRVRVLAQLDSSVGASVSINNHSGNLYSVSYDLLAEDGDVVDIDIELDSGMAGAFNMLDVYAASTQFIRELTNASMPDLNVFWQDKSSRYGTYYCFTSRTSSSCPRGRGIYILGGKSSGGDTDHFDDDVLLHEYAHYLETMVGAQDSPGGIHYLTETDQDLRLSWSEGLGGFFPVAVKTWMAANHPELLSLAPGLATTYFIDTYGSYVGISMNLDNPTSYFCYGGGASACFSYSSSEIAVAKILIGVMNEFGVQAIWDIYSNHMARGTSLPSTLETFWDGWMAQRAPSADELANLSAVFNERRVYYQEDGFEMDNVIGVSRKLDSCPDDSCDSEQHYLYHQDLNNDKDLVAFDARPSQTYFIETMDLSNAADTYLRILDSNGNVAYDAYGQLMVNDNRPGTVFCGPYDNPCRIRNDDLTLSSELYFKPKKGGTYYVEVTASPSRPTSSGRYGTYSLQISH